jgi:hypothetical protein
MALMLSPEDEHAQAALEDPEYYQKMAGFDEKIHQLTEPLWQERASQKSD